jgi:hypothetical protein
LDGWGELALPLFFYEVLVFLIPIGIYCLLLSSINRRPTPVLVSGFWDTVGLLFAGAGFFLGTIPMLLHAWYDQSMKFNLGEMFATIYLRHLLIWLLYYLLLICGSVFLFQWRSSKTMIYNVDNGLLQPLLEVALAALGLAATTRKNHLVIAPLSERQDAAIMAGVPGQASAPPPAGRHAVLTIENFPALCHATLHWIQCAPELRLEIEKELQNKLENATPADNPAAGWFLSVGSLILSMLIMVVLTIPIMMLFSR